MKLEQLEDHQISLPSNVRLLFFFRFVHIRPEYIHCIFNSGADPGFWERGGLINIFKTGGGYGRGRAPSRDSKGVWGER